MEADFNELFDDGFAINVLRDVTPAHFRASLRWLRSMSESERWNLSEHEISILLDIKASDLQSFSERSSEINSSDAYFEVVERISLLLKLSKFLKMMSLSGEVAASDRLFLAPNFFNGCSIKQLLLENNSMYNFYTVVSNLSLLTDITTVVQLSSTSE